MFAVVHRIRNHMTPPYPIMGAVNFDYLVKIVSPRILHYNIATFPFITDKDLVGRCKYPVHQTFTH